MRRLILLILMLAAIRAVAQDFMFDGIPYTIYDKDAKTCMVRPVRSTDAQNDISGDVVLPSKVFDGDTEYTLVKIGSQAFYGCKNMTSIEIPPSVKYIGEGAFILCSGLKKVALPEGVTEIPLGAFQLCSGLEDVILPSTLKIINTSAFHGCSNLTKIELPETLEELGSSVFYACESLTSINFPCGISEIPSNCFYGCGFVSLELPDWIINIQNQAFNSNRKLEQLTLPDGLTNIGYLSFYGCSSLKKITCKAVKAPTLNFSTFKNCNNAECVLNVPEGSEQSYIYGGWIADSHPNSFTNVSNSKGEKVAPVYIGKIPRYVVDNQNKTAYLAPLSGDNRYELTSIEIPTEVDGYIVAGIAPYALQNASMLSLVKISETVKEIGSCAFALDTCLRQVIIPESVTAIGDGIFYMDRNLASVKLPSKIAEIGNATFVSCTNLIDIEIPKQVKKIGESAFAGCTELESLNLPFGIESIGGFAFRSVSKVSSLDLPQSIKYIGPSAFLSFGMQAIDIPCGLTTIEENAFSGCKNVTKIVVPSSVTTIKRNGLDRRCFTVEGVYVSPDVYIGSGIKTIGFNGINGKNIYIAAEEPPVTDGTLAYSPDEDEYITVYVQGEEAKDRYESVYPWYLYKIVSMVEAKEINVDMESIVGNAGETFRPKVTFVPDDATMQEVEWTTSDPRVAIVDVNGCITLTFPEVEQYGSRVNEEVKNTCKIIASTLYHDGPVAEILVTNTSIAPAETVDASASVANVPRHIYNMLGVCIKKNATDAEVRALPAGFYIVGGKKLIVR